MMGADQSHQQKDKDQDEQQEDQHQESSAPATSPGEAERCDWPVSAAML